MKKLFLALWLSLVSLPVLAQGNGYLLNPGDVLEVSVWKEEGLTRDVLVLPDGMISFPLAGHLKAAGQTAASVQAALTKSLQQYIPEPVVTVTVREVSGNRIYVIGQVNNPGEFPAGHNIDVMQALSLAGGLSAFGDENDIKVLRRQGDKQISFPFDYSAVKKGKNLELNIVLQAGDIVVVPD